jgi:hypothetical protein
MTVNIEVNRLPPFKVGLLFRDPPALLTRLSSVDMTQKRTEAEMYITHQSILASSTIQAKYLFVTGVPIELIKDDQKPIRDGLFESINEGNILHLASFYDKETQQLISIFIHVKKALNKLAFWLIIELDKLIILLRFPDTISDKKLLLREIPLLYHYIDKQGKL